MTATSIATANETALFGVYNNSLSDGTQDVSHDLKFALLTAPNTTDATNTISVNMMQYGGIKKLLGVKRWVHTTDNSVLTPENPTCTVDEGNVVLTVPAGTDDDMRVYLLIGV